MNVWACYLIALIPLIAAGILWYKFKKIVWWEAVIIPVIGLITAFIFNYLAVKGMTTDTETWSGQVTEAVYIPSWVEYYEYAVYRTEVYTTVDSKGHSHIHTRQVFDHWQPSTRTHVDCWTGDDTVNGSYDIDQNRYKDIVQKFGASTTRAGTRTTSSHNSRMISGDPNDYPSVNKNKYVYPTTSTRSWENKIKACPSVFSYKKVDPKEPVFEYPQEIDKFASGRLLGQTGGLGLLQWDQMNSVLGPTKYVNVIAVGFGPNSDSSLAETQEAKWIGGKKNDLVICFGGGTQMQPSWVKVFGWSESDLAKLNIQSLILKYGTDPQVIPLIQAEIVKNYEIKDWSKFDYLQVEIPFHLWCWMFITVIVLSGGFAVFAWYNDIDKERAFR